MLFRSIVEEGHAEAAFLVVGAGPNGASPHHDVSDRVIESGELVVIDIGGPLPSGYNSDCTRTYAVGGEPPAAVREAYAVLQDAQERAVRAVRPGVTAEQVDAAAREPITAAGLGERFIHRTGHGIGLEIHEPPYLRPGNPEPLQVGYVFSVEPGIYVPGRFGVRFENLVHLGADGPELLNEAPRELALGGPS